MKTKILLTGLSILAAVFSFRHLTERPRVFAPNEVSTAFWAWRNRTPSTDEVEQVFAATNSQILFLRFGQFDFANGRIQRIRSVSGKIPDAHDIHCVYNGTRRYIGEWDRLEADAIAAEIANTYKVDQQRAIADQTQLNGLQLDIDVPTRLLSKYAETLRQLRLNLPANTKLSITGLATWTTSPDLRLVLKYVDFWAPQCYGSSIPTDLNEHNPISSEENVKRFVEAARDIDKPFYMGLATYGYAILYSQKGELVELRGDIDQIQAESSGGLEVVETRRLADGEIQTIYSAKDDIVVNDLIIKKGEALLFDTPTAASLRTAMHVVRENAGTKLLGLCLFRMPATEDATNLTTSEIVTALADAATEVHSSVKIKALSDRLLGVEVENIGSSRTFVTEDAFTVDIQLPDRGVDYAADLKNFETSGPMCRSAPYGPLMSCSPKRANMIRLSARSWKPLSTASAFIALKGKAPVSVDVVITSRVNDGRTIREEINVPIGEVK